MLFHLKEVNLKRIIRDWGPFLGLNPRASLGLNLRDEVKLAGNRGTITSPSVILFLK
jgi:hypothetical protein